MLEAVYQVAYELWLVFLIILTTSGILAMLHKAVSDMFVSYFAAKLGYTVAKEEELFRVHTKQEAALSENREEYFRNLLNAAVSGIKNDEK